MTFQLDYASGEKGRMDADRFDLFGSLRGAAGCDGQHLSVMVGQVSIFKSGFVSEYTL